MVTKIGLPAFWASAKAVSLKGRGFAADAGDTPAALAAAAARRTERRDSMGNPSLVLLDGRSVIHADGARSHSQSGRRNQISLIRSSLSAEVALQPGRRSRGHTTR